MYLGIALVVLDVLQIPTGNAGGHLAHIGGAALGYLYAMQLQQGRDIGSGFERLWKAFASLGKPRAKMKPVYRAPKKSKTKNSLSEQEKIDLFLVLCYCFIWFRLFSLSKRRAESSKLDFKSQLVTDSSSIF